MSKNGIIEKKLEIPKIKKAKNVKSRNPKFDKSKKQSQKIQKTNRKVER